MADPATDQVVAGLVLSIGGLAAVAFFELRFLRNRRKNRRVRTAKQDAELPDGAHNAIVTTKAILTSLERQGIRSEEASAWLREAEMAYERRNYRVALDLTGKTKDRLLSAKAAQASKGDIAKLAELPVAGPDEEITTKELLTKEMPPNLLQSKFSIELAETSIENGRSTGRDVSQAMELLSAARGRFEAKEYDAALLIARQSKRAANGEKLEVAGPPSKGGVPVAAARPCPSCGSLLRSDDAFCRKCGARLAPPTCTSCGVELLPDDAFCRKCGTTVHR